MTNEQGHYAHVAYGCGEGFMELPTYFPVDEATKDNDGKLHITSWHRKGVSPGAYILQDTGVKLLHWLTKDLFEFEGKQYTRKWFTSVKCKSACMSFTLNLRQ